MSKINRLAIRGVRSFDATETHTIEFLTPLTLIVGRNGTGKTTIIECLKYVTTGEMPPGGKGGAFVHDPRMAHETTIKAQIKLNFTARDGKDVVCIRSVQLTQKKVKTEMKTLDGVLSVTDKESGEVSSLSKRCSEMDIEMPILLGVSKAILENVIFCHQEESNWPLSDPTTLKKKFDDIFAVSKYTKALDILKTCRKEKAADYKVQQNEMVHLEKDKERADALHSKVKEVDDRITHCQRQDETFDDQLVAIRSETLELSGKRQAIDQVDEDIRSCERDINSHTTLLMDLDLSITYLHKNKDELGAMRNEHDSRVANMQGFTDDLIKKRQDHGAALTRLNAQLNDLATRKGQFEAEYNFYIAKMSSRNGLIKDFLEKQGIGFAGFTDDVQNNEQVASKFLKVLQNLVRTKQRELEQKKAQCGQELAEIDAKIQTSSSAIAVKQELSKNNRVQALATRLRDAEDKFQLSSTADRRLDGLKSQVETQKGKVDALNSEIDALQKNELIVGYKQRQKDIDDAVKEIHSKQSMGRQTAEYKAKHDLKVQEKQKKDARVQSLCDQHANVARPFGDVRTESPATVFRLAKNANVAELADAESNYNQARTTFTQLSIKQSMLKSDLESKQNQLDTLQAEITQFATVNLDRDIQDEIEAARGELSTYTHGSSLYGELSREAQQADSCPLCDRSFDGDGLHTFVDKITHLTASFPEQAKVSEEKLKQLTHDDKEISEARAKKTALESLEAEVEQIERQLRTMDREHREVKKTQDQLFAAKTELSHLLQGRDGLSAACDEIDRLTDEVKLIDQEIADNSSRMSSLGVQEDPEALEDELYELSVTKEKLTRQYDKMLLDIKMRTSNWQDMEKLYRDGREELLNLEHESADQTRLKNLVESTQEELTNAKDDVRFLETETRDLKRQHAALLDKRAEVKRSWDDDLRKIETGAKEVTDGCSKIESLQTEIDHCRRDNSDSTKDRLDQEMRSLRQKVETHTREFNAVQHELATQSQAVSDLNVLDRNIKDNLRDLRLKEEKAGFEERLRQLNEKVGHMNKNQVNYRLNELKLDETRISGHRASLTGQMAQLKENKRDLQQQLTRDYNDINDTYRIQTINVKTLELAIADLDTTVKTLDKAILQFHTSRMEKINRVIKRLWQVTYKGNDIDTIAIRSEVESTRGNRSYNYRVIMVKSGTEIDMRGRCSAGQRVLTSIIVRLALAETFCQQNCGILALDEPTTNLDKENVESLAESLNDIIELRQNQQNFQLVIITHDESFLALLGHSAHADNFYQIDRGPNGSSRITTKPMRSL